MKSSADALLKQHVSPIVALAEQGQSVWLDFIDRRLIESGELEKYVERRGLRGLTSNPSIFEKAIAESTAYDSSIRSLLDKEDRHVKDLLDDLTIRDIRDAADLLNSVYLESQFLDGYVSLEVSPHLAYDTEGTIEEAQRLWQKVDRPNLMIKVPGTSTGIPAVEYLIAQGINVNITLLFDRKMYKLAASAYLSGLESALSNGRSLERIASVASFFVSRIDSAVDQKITAVLESVITSEKKLQLQSLLGKVAIANAKLAYEDFKEIINSFRWKNLSNRGAQIQRLLWASTGVKNPKYRDVRYVEELVGPHTVNTMPPGTFSAFEDHGQVRSSLEDGISEAKTLMGLLEKLCISLDGVTESLLVQGVQLFSDPYDRLMGVLERKRKEFLRLGINSLELRIPILTETVVGESLLNWKQENKVKRLWQKDASLWSHQDESQWMGWLTVIEAELAQVEEFNSFQREVKNSNLSEAILLGMGGSSLCADVLDMTFEKPKDFPNFHILDSTDPNQIRSLESKLNLEKTLFIVSSKSGTTLETNLFLDYFYDKVKSRVGEGAVGQHFIAITDPGSKLETLAKSRGFRRVFHGIQSIGGRYSALSPFGLVPAAVMGVPIEEVLKSARAMKYSCIPEVPPQDNPGVLLGVTLGTLAQQGRDKVTLISSPEIWNLGVWLEQLLAESTGKQGRGLIPISEERAGPPELYDDDRIFVYLRAVGGYNPELDVRIKALEEAEHPVVWIHISGPNSIGQEFFRWEIATAVAGSILRINPFDQPDVEASKVETAKIMAEYGGTGSLSPEVPFFDQDGIQLFTDPGNRGELQQRCEGSRSFESYLKAYFERIQPKDYFAILAYLEMNLENEDILQESRHWVRDRKRVATCLEFGPRFLHSTGQLYKGGPNTGVFLQVTSDPTEDIPVPNRNYTFGVVKMAQARGDFDILVGRKRRVLRVHLGKNTLQGLERLNAAIKAAIPETDK